MDFPTQNDLFRIAQDEILAQNGDLTLEAAQRTGTDLNILLNAGAAMGDEVVTQLVNVEAGLYLASATGAKLDRLIFDRYGLTRKQAAVARGSVEFRTTASNPAPFTIPGDTVLSTADGAQYATVGAALFPAAITGPVVVPVRSLLAGLDQQAASGAITSVITGIPGQPTDLRVTNTLATSGAANEEPDPDYRDRARRFWISARRGTAVAVEAGARAVAGVQSARAIEVVDTLGRPARIVQLVITDTFTDALVNLNANPPTYQQQSQQLAVSVFASLDEFRPIGTFIQVFVAQVIILPITLSLKFNSGADPDLTALIARATVSAYVSTLAPGQTFSRAAALTFLQAIPGLFFTGEEIASPAGDVVPRTLQVLRASLNHVTAGAVQGGTPLVATANPDAFILRS